MESGCSDTDQACEPRGGERDVGARLGLRAALNGGGSAFPRSLMRPAGDCYTAFVVEVSKLLPTILF